MEGLAAHAGHVRRRRPARHLGVIFALLGTLTSAACASSGAHTVSWPEPGARGVSHGEWIQTWPHATASIAEVMERTLGLPPLEFTIYFFPSRKHFELALVDEGYPPAFARQTAEALDGIGGSRRVLINEAAVSRAPWANRVAFIAHELVHVLQYQLGGGRRGASEQWLREGFAEWVSARVASELRFTMPGDQRRRARRDIAVAGVSRLPALDEMMTFRQWVDLRTDRPNVPTYAYAHLAVDFLIDRHGMESVLDYFTRFADSDDTVGIFEAAFGESRQQFESALLTHFGRR